MVPELKQLTVRKGVSCFLFFGFFFSMKQLYGHLSLTLKKSHL